MEKKPVLFRVVTLFNGEEVGTYVTATSKAGARRAVGGKIVRIEPGSEITEK